jgi:FAD/FMN-containing dehydrogenase
MSPTPSDAFFREARAALPEDGLTTDPAELAEYGRDWTKVFPPAPSAVAFPRSTAEVAALVGLCQRHQVAVVPSGGRTGLAGGAMATNGELVLSLQRMNRMGEVELLGSTVEVEAGAVTEAVHRHCQPHGLTWPVDFASKGSSTVGGNIATNAGGVKVIRYGLTRQWVLGLEVVTASGQVLQLNGALEKNNTGLDLRQLFIGSEGTLGIITKALLKLTPLPGRQDVMLLAVPDIASVLRLFRDWRRAPFLLAAYEFFTDKCLARLMRHRKLRAPFDAPSPCYVLVETEGADPERLETYLGTLFERGLVTDGTMAQSPSQAKDLWEYREGISESLSGTGLPHKNDVALPVGNLEAFCAELDQVFAARAPAFEVALFGHIGDGNLHINVMKPDGMEKAEFFRHTHAADHAMFELVRRHGGSISAEHGIGLLKKDFLRYSRSPEELAMQRAVKHALDPANLLNPGKIFDSET